MIEAQGRDTGFIRPKSIILTICNIWKFPWIPVAS
jgi:hypothetical protein